MTTDLNAHQATLEQVQNGLNDVQGDLAVFYDRGAYPDGEGLAAGNTAVAAVNEAIENLTALAEELTDAVRGAETTAGTPA